MRRLLKGMGLLIHWPAARIFPPIIEIFKQRDSERTTLFAPKNSAATVFRDRRTEHCLFILQIFDLISINYQNKVYAKETGRTRIS